MDVGFCDELDRETLLLRVRRIAVEVAHRVDHNGLALRGENIRILGQTCYFELLDLHRFALP